MKIMEALWCFNRKIHMQHFCFPSYLLEVLDWCSAANISHLVMWVIKHSVCKLSILHWRVGDIQQMRRLARGNHGNLATGQPWHLFTLSASGKTYTYHLLPSGESGCGKSPKHSKPCAQVKHEIKTTAMARAQWRGLLTSNAFQVKLHYKWPHESHIWPPVIAHWVSWFTLYNLCRKM